MKKYSFEMLPYYITQIEERLERIENLLSEGRVSTDETEYIGAKEASELLKFTLSTLYTKVCKGEVPSFKKGNRLYFSRSGLIEWIENGKKATVDEIEREAYKIAVNMGKRSRI